MNIQKRSKYRVIYADPPWPEYGGEKIKRGADRHYPLMSLNAILQLGDALQDYFADDGCHLYHWVTNCKTVASQDDEFPLVHYAPKAEVTPSHCDV